jgi:hypothetical protein
MVHLRGKKDALLLDFIFGKVDEGSIGVGHLFQVLRSFDNNLIDDKTFRGLPVNEKRNLLKAVISPARTDFINELPATARVGDYIFHNRLWVTGHPETRSRLLKSCGEMSALFQRRTIYDLLMR